MTFERTFLAPARRLAWLLCSVGLGLVLVSGAARAQDDPPGRVGRIAETQGTVWLLDPAENEWVAAQRNRPVTTGDRVATDAGGRAELQIGSTTVRLGGATELTFSTLDDAQIRLALERGTVALRVRSSEVAREVELQTDVGRLLPQQAGHYRIDTTDTGMLAGVWSGAARFDAPDSALDVRAGQRAEFWREGSATHYTWSTATQDPFADWVLAQDRADDARLAALGRDVSPELTGVDDLGRYGEWDTHPEYGAVWAPTSVAAGWAPYRFGQWMWQAPWGWTWVDDAPWGFAPFHYGRWVQWRGRWSWAPGTYVSRPVYAPALVGWIGGSNVSVGVNIGGGLPYVGWVPLAPREPFVPGYRVGPRHRDGFDPFYGRGRPPPGWRPPQRGHGDRFSNELVPGGFTGLPSDGFRHRQPIGDRFIGDSRGARDFFERRRDNYMPPPPARSVTPGGAENRGQPPWPDRRRDNNASPPSRVIDTGPNGFGRGGNGIGSGIVGRPAPGRDNDGDGRRDGPTTPRVLPGTPQTATPFPQRDRDRDGDRGNGRGWQREGQQPQSPFDRDRGRQVERQPDRQPERPREIEAPGGVRGGGFRGGSRDDAAPSRNAPPAVAPAPRIERNEPRGISATPGIGGRERAAERAVEQQNRNQQFRGDRGQRQ